MQHILFQLAERPPHYCSACEAKLNQDTPPSRAPVAATEMSDLHTEHVRSEGLGQGEPMYEDILPHVKDDGRAIELEMNVAYSTATATK